MTKTSKTKTTEVRVATIAAAVGFLEKVIPAGQRDSDLLYETIVALKASLKVPKA